MADLSLLAIFLEGVYKTATTGLVPPLEDPRMLNIKLPHTRAEEFLKVLDDPDLPTYLSTSIEVQHVQILEQDAIFQMVDDFCNSYTEALKQGPSNGVDGSDPNHTSTTTTTTSHQQLQIQQMHQLQQHQQQEFNDAHTLHASQQILSHHPQQQQQLMMEHSPGLHASTDSQKDTNDLGSSSEGGSSSGNGGTGSGGGNKKRRGNLPKTATNILKQWLWEHVYHPYPTEEEKKLLEGKTGMSLNQISNWFINARRRILQPMLESVKQSAVQSGQLGSQGLLPVLSLPQQQMLPSQLQQQLMAEQDQAFMNQTAQVYRSVRG